MGFYKINIDEGGFFHAPNFVYNASFGKITKDLKDKETLEPIDGWKWFETETNAYTYFNVSIPEQDKSILQAKLALQNAGMLDQVEFKNPTSKRKWDKADIKTETPILTEIATKLDMTEAQKIEAFKPVEKEVLIKG